MRLEVHAPVVTAQDVEAERRKIEFLIAARDAARKIKDFEESDRIRDELAAMGVVLKDSKDGTTWEIAR
jgi:cysteinyl-tRNA synthetase